MYGSLSRNCRHDIAFFEEIEKNQLRHCRFIGRSLNIWYGIVKVLQSIDALLEEV